MQRQELKQKNVVRFFVDPKGILHTRRNPIAEETKTQAVDDLTGSDSSDEETKKPDVVGLTSNSTQAQQSDVAASLKAYGPR